MDQIGAAFSHDETQVTGTQSIGRAVAILRLLAARPRDGAGLSELVSESGLAKPTCRRILLALIEAGLAEQAPGSRRYFLGPEAFVIGTLASERFGVHRLAMDGVMRLARHAGDAAFFQIRRGFSVVCLQREEGDYPIRSHVLKAGDRHPLGAGAGGLALLAAMSDTEIDLALSANAQLLAQSYQVLTPARLDTLIIETRTRGYALNRGLLFPGSWGMGMVVRDPQGRAETCYSLAAIESRMQPEREAELVALLSGEVRRLEQMLNDQGLAGLGTAPARTINERKPTP